jgi:hypothetical protein
MNPKAFELAPLAKKPGEQSRITGEMVQPTEVSHLTTDRHFRKDLKLSRHRLGGAPLFNSSEFAYGFAGGVIQY